MIEYAITLRKTIFQKKDPSKLQKKKNWKVADDDTSDLYKYLIKNGIM